MRWAVVVALLAGLGGATFMAAPAFDAERSNRETAAMCAMFRSGGSEAGRRAAPEVCRRPPERTHWATDWLAIAAVLAVGAGVVAVMPRHR